MTELIDSHAHLQEPEFAEDASEVIKRANAAGVMSMVVPGVDLETSEAALRLCEEHEGLYAAAGFHPHEASRLDAASLAGIERLLAHEKTVAVGEIGLDYYRLHSPREAQLEAIGSILALAKKQALPVIVHIRDAWEDAASVLLPWARDASSVFEGRPLGVIHYFTGDLQAARSYIDAGFLISIHTSVTHPKGAALRDVVAELPLESLVIETDSPYGAPQAYRGKRNESSYVIEAAKCIAEVQGVSLEDVARETTANARRLFPKMNRVAAGTRAGAVS